MSAASISSSALDPAYSERVIAALREARERLEAAESRASEPIAIVGMGCRFPGGANDPVAYWERLVAGVDAVRSIPRERYDVASCYDSSPATPGALYVREAALVDNIEGFDAAFFGVSPREAMHLDPQQRLLLEVAWEALEHAAQAPDALRGTRTGVFIGIGRSDHLHRCLNAASSGLTAWDATGNGLCFGPGRLAHVLDLQGPNLTIDTACSSSLVAVHLACQSLRLRECHLALAGGCHLHLSPHVPIMLSMSRALAPDGRCKAFDASADGFGQGEGCGVVVLRRLSDALERGDRILALIRGSAVNHDGHSSGLTVPNQAAQERVIADALANAGVQPGEIGYVEAHGTGTSLGDPIEVEALAAVLRGAGCGHDDPLRIGSVKTNIAHLEAAAGIAGLIKVVLALMHRTIPPHLHLRRPNPRIDWAALPIDVPTRLTPWPNAADAVGAPRLAGVSSFGMSGTNAHVVLQAAPSPRASEMSSARAAQVIAVSARSRSALQAQAERFAAHLRAHPEMQLADVALTANVGRMHFPVRAGVVAASRDELVRGLSDIAAGTVETGCTSGDDADAPGVAFLFSGQGAQYARMGCGLLRSEPVFRRMLERCDEVLAPCLGTSIVGLLRADDDSRLHETAFTQPALFAIEYALAALWRSWGIEPRAVLGHSVGELCAACVAEVLELDDALRLVAERARLMQALPRGGMAAVEASEQRVRGALSKGADAFDGHVSIAAVNGDASVALSGPAQALQTVLERLEADGVKVRALKVSHAFHSAMLDPMLEPLAHAARGMRHSAPRIDWVSNVSGRVHEGWGDGYHEGAANPDAWAAYWSTQARRPVRFADGLDTLRACGVRACIEVGPGSTLIALAARRYGDDAPALLPSLLPGRDEARTLSISLARLYELGVRVDWAGRERGRGGRPVALPTYPFERQRYWRDWAPVAAVPAARMPLPAYRLVWQPQAAAPCVPGPHQWWVIDDDGAFGTRVGAALERLGLCVRVVKGVAGFERWLVSQSAESAGEGVLWGCDSAHALGPHADAQALLAAQTRDCTGLLKVVNAMAAAGAAHRGLRLWIVTRGGVEVDASDAAPQVASACLRGFAKVIALEHPGFWGGTIDVPFEPAEADLAAAAAELSRSGVEDAIAWRDGRRFVARIEQLADTGMPTMPVALRADATYLVTGGLGALGLQVADWMVARGARRLVLTARHAPSPQASATLAALRQRGATVVTAMADVANEQELQRVLDDIDTPLAGVVHAAGVSRHEPLESLDAETMEAVLRPKVAGAWLLHRLTKPREPELFVLFSSVAALWGSKGQAHYAAANAFLDALALHRRRMGLPALSIAWGPWQGDGMATADAREWLARVGVRAFAPVDALTAMERHLAGAASHVAVADVDWPRFREVYAAGRERPLLALLDEPAAAVAENTSSGARAALEAEYASLAPAARLDWLVGHVQRRVAGVLGLGEAELPDVRKGFFRLGMDSLMAIELRNSLARDFGITLASTVVFDRPTAAALAQAIAQALGWDEEGASTPDAVASDETLAAGLAGRIARLESLVRPS